jgi:hypothetical protein
MYLDVTEDSAVAVEERESLELRWSEDKMAGLKRLRKGENDDVSASVVDGWRSSTTESVWGSDLIAGDDARRQFDSDWESTDFDFLAIVLKSRQRRG